MQKLFVCLHFYRQRTFFRRTRLFCVYENNDRNLVFIFPRRRKCDIELRDRDSKSIMEPRDLSSSARLFPNAQIKIRWVLLPARRETKELKGFFFFLLVPSQHITHHVTNVKFIVTRTHDWITTGKSRIIVSRWLYSYETNYRDSVRCRCKPVYSSSSH